MTRKRKTEGDEQKTSGSAKVNVEWVVSKGEASGSAKKQRRDEQTTSGPVKRKREERISSQSSATSHPHHLEFATTREERGTYKHSV